MTLAMLKVPDSFSERDQEAAREASRALAQMAGRECVHVEADAGDEVGAVKRTFILPAPAVRMLTEILAALADGRSVIVSSGDAELTTQQAADLLNVSRPFLVKLLESNKLPFRLAGTHRRVRLDDVNAYRMERDKRSQVAMDELAAEAQKLGLGH
jgi:excisionase family DNA binding protein